MAAREELIIEIEKIIPSALIKVMPQIVDPGCVNIDVKQVFEYYCS